MKKFIKVKKSQFLIFYHIIYYYLQQIYYISNKLANSYKILLILTYKP